MRALSLIPLLLLLTGCGGGMGDIATEAEALKAAQAAARGAAGPFAAKAGDLNIKLAFRPINATFDRLVAAPEEGRTVRFQGVSHTGRLYHTSHGTLMGNAEKWAAMENDNETQARVRLDEVELVAADGTLRASATIHSYFQCRIHGHYDGGLGGGIGTNVFVDSTNPNVQLVGTLSFGAPTEGRVPYSLVLSEPFNVVVTAHLGAFGNRDFTFNQTDIGAGAIAGSFPLLVGFSGALNVPGATPDARAYAIAVTAAPPVIDAGSVTISGTAAITWQ